MRSRTSAPTVPARERDSIVGRVHQLDRASRRVVRGEHPARSARAGCGGEIAGEQPMYVLDRHAAGSQDLRGRGRTVDDRALHADRTRATVEDRVASRIEPVSDVAKHVLGCRRTDRPEPVRRRRSQTDRHPVEQIQRHPVGRNPQPDRVESSRDDVEHPDGTGKNHGERSGPRSIDQDPRRRGNRRGPSVDLLR